MNMNFISEYLLSYEKLHLIYVLLKYKVMKTQKSE